MSLRWMQKTVNHRIQNPRIVVTSGYTWRWVKIDFEGKKMQKTRMNQMRFFLSNRVQKICERIILYRMRYLHKIEVTDPTTLYDVVFSVGNNTRAYSITSTDKVSDKVSTKCRTRVPPSICRKKNKFSSWVNINNKRCFAVPQPS